jgi:hypothetical protein
MGQLFLAMQGCGSGLFPNSVGLVDLDAEAGKRRK